MEKKYRGRKALFIAVAIYLSGVIFVTVCWLIFLQHKNLSEFDKRLLVAAEALPGLLPKDFHDRALNKDSIGPEEDQRNLDIFSTHSRIGGFAYLYTYVMDQGQIYFTASSYTDDDVAKGQVSRYWTPYPEGHQAYFNAIKSTGPVFVTASDRWGSFRTVLTPRRSPTGNPYVVGVDIDISEIDKLLWKHFAGIMIAASLLMLFAVPIAIAMRQTLVSINNDLWVQLDENKKAAAEKAQLQEQLFQAQKMESVGRLAGGVAHDFNNMLMTIIGNTELAMEAVDPSTSISANLQDILSSAQRSADLTRQLLAFARKQTINPRILELNKFVSGMIKMLQRLIGEDINLVYKTTEDLWLVKMDPSQIDQILVNLAVNARDAIAGVGNLTIEIENIVFNETDCLAHEGLLPGEYVLLSVSDTGSGMEKETLEHLFEPFYTTKEVGKGTGLGLATIYGIVMQNNGFITADSKLGQGTTFKIYLPRTRSEETMETQDALKKPALGTETVLLVEDDLPILNLGKTILDRYGYTVVAAHTPLEAQKFAEQHQGPINLLITDVIMPQMNGRDLVEKLSVSRPGIKILYMSGYTADVIAHHGILDKGFNFLQKPFSTKTLVAKVREVLDHSDGA